MKPQRIGMLRTILAIVVRWPSFQHHANYVLISSAKLRIYFQMTK